MTVRLYNTLVELLPRTPIKFHYIFNLRDLSRVYEGLCRSTVEYFNQNQQFIRLWRNECLRVFGDKLINNEDRDLVEQYIKKLVDENFKTESEYILQDPLLFGDYMSSNPSEPETVDPRIYQDCGEFDFVSKKFNSFLTMYNVINFIIGRRLQPGDEAGAVQGRA